MEEIAERIEEQGSSSLEATYIEASSQPIINHEQEDHEKVLKNHGDDVETTNKTEVANAKVSNDAASASSGNISGLQEQSANGGGGASSGAAGMEVEPNESSDAADNSTPTAIMQTKSSRHDGDNASDDSDAEVGAFDLLASRKRKRKKAKAKTISIGLPSPPCEQDEAKGKSQELDVVPDIRGLDFLKEEEEICYDFDFDDEEDNFDSSQTNSVIDSQLQVEIAALLAEKEADVAKIQAYLKSKWVDRTKDVQNQINKLRAEMLLKQERQREQLADNHKRHLAEDEKRMDEGLAWLRLEQKKELEMKLQKHREDEQEGTLDQESTMEWNTFMAQLKSRHEEQVKLFEEQKRAVRKKSEKELRAQSMILTTHHKKRQAEADQHVQNSLAKKCLERQEQLKAKLLKLHTERYDKKLAKLRSRVSSSCDNVKSCVNPESAHQLKLDHDESGSSLCHQAVARHKRRKISTNNASFGMSIEVHNEGIIMQTKSTDTDHSDSSTHSHRNNAFIPWGVKARNILHSVIYGEIPSCSEINLTHLNSSGKQDLDGGMVRCMITDMRTSQDTASCHRAETYVNHLVSINGQEIQHLTEQQSSIRKEIETLTSEYKSAAQIEETAANAEKEAFAAHKGSRDTWNMFKNQAQHFFSTVSQDNKSKLLGAMTDYKDNYETTKDALLASKKSLESARVVAVTKRMELQRLKEQSANNEKKLKALKRESSPLKVLKSTQDITGARVESIITTIHNVAEKRRSIVNEKKTNGTMSSEWKGVTLDKKSIWQKMQRKRVNTVLRTSHHSIVRNLVLKTESSRKPSDCFDMGNEDAAVDPSLRAEELLLLALHPEAPSGTFSGSPETEPGWRVCLDPPPPDNPRSILYTDREGILGQSFLSVCCSTGRQAASFIESHRLRTLDNDAPLSFATKVSCLAETNPTQDKKATADVLNADPLAVSDEQMKLGYSFVVKDSVESDPSAKKAPETKKKSTSKAKSKSKTEPKKAKSASKNAKGAAKSGSKSQVDDTQQQQQVLQSILDSTLTQSQAEIQYAERKRMLETNKQNSMNANQTARALQQPLLLQSQQLQPQQNLQQQQQFQNFFNQNPLVHSPSGLPLNQQNQGLLPGSSQQRPQMPFNYLQQQPRLSLTQPQMAQLMQQNNIMGGNNVQMQGAQQQRLPMPHPQMAQLMQQSMNAMGNNMPSLQMNMMGNGQIQGQQQGMGQPPFQQMGKPGDNK